MGDIKSILIKSIDFVVFNSKNLIEKEIGERTICGRLQIQIHSFLKKNQMVDIEYDRYMNKSYDFRKNYPFDIKKAENIIFEGENNKYYNEKYKEYLKKNFMEEFEEKRFIPDIIIHDGSDNNYALIEVKKAENTKKENDIFKLALIMTLNKEIQYDYYFFLEYSKECFYTLYELKRKDDYCVYLETLHSKNDK